LKPFEKKGAVKKRELWEKSGALIQGGGKYSRRGRDRVRGKRKGEAQWMILGGLKKS